MFMPDLHPPLKTRQWGVHPILILDIKNYVNHSHGMETQNNIKKMSVSREFDIVHKEHLDLLCYKQYHGITVYKDVIILWDEDYDTRVMGMIDVHFPAGSVKPIAIHESKGSVNILWPNEAGWWSVCDNYDVENDSWCPTHYHRDGVGIIEIKSDQ